MTKERLSTIDANFCDQILRYENIKKKIIPLGLAVKTKDSM